MTEWGKVAIKELIYGVIRLSQKALGRHSELVKFGCFMIQILLTNLNLLILWLLRLR